MSYSIDLTYRGLAIEATIDEYDRGSYWQPPEGGTCDDFTWEVDDIDELLGELELESEGLERMVRAFYRMFERLPATLKARIDRDWEDDIYQRATDYFWEDVGGPSGYRDYCYDG